MLDKLQKQLCRTGGTGGWTCYFSWTLCLLLKCNQSKFLLCRYFLELPESFPQAFCRRSTCCSKRLLGFSSAIYGWYNNVYVRIFFPYTATLWSSLPAECFHLAYRLIIQSLHLICTFHLALFLISFPISFSSLSYSVLELHALFKVNPNKINIIGNSLWKFFRITLMHQCQSFR